MGKPTHTNVESQGDGDFLRRIGRLEATAAVAEVSGQYCHGFDKRKLDLFLSQWDEAAIFQFGRYQRWQGHQTISDAVSDLWTVRAHSVHLSGNLVVTQSAPGSGVASARSDCVAVMVLPDQSRELVCAAYRDRLVQVAGTWRFAEREAAIRRAVPLPPLPATDPEKDSAQENEVHSVTQDGAVMTQDPMARLERLEDRQAICDVMSNYCQGLDGRDLTLFMDQFESTATLNIDGDVLSGHPAIRKRIEEMTGPKLKRSTHLTGNTVIAFAPPAGDTGDLEARVMSDCLAILIRDTGEAVLATEVLRDRLSNRTGRWRFVERQVQGTGRVVLAQAPK